MSNVSKVVWAAALALVLETASAGAQQVGCTNGQPNCTAFQGTVGINTTAPTATLDLFGGNMVLRMPAGVPYDAQVGFRLDDVPDNKGYWILSSRKNPLLPANPGLFTFYNVGFNVEPLHLLSDGTATFTKRVGIGTWFPSQLLELYKDNADVAMTFQDPNDYIYSAGINRAAGGVFGINRGSSPLQASDLTINWTTGNVGVNTSTAPQKLTVNGSLGVQNGGVVVGGSTVIASNGTWVGSPTGLQGPPGPQGPQGPPGPPVSTSAGCATGACDCGVICGASRFVVAGGSAPCSVTSDTGSCSLPAQPICASCCVCSPVAVR